MLELMIACILIHEFNLPWWMYLLALIVALFD